MVRVETLQPLDKWNGICNFAKKGVTMEVIIGIVFIVFVIARVLLGKEDSGSSGGHRPGASRRADDDDGGKYPPSYY